MLVAGRHVAHPRLPLSHFVYVCVFLHMLVLVALVVALVALPALGVLHDRSMACVPTARSATLPR